MEIKVKGGSLISKIHFVSSRIFYSLLNKAGITDLNAGQGRILFALFKKDDISIQELCKKTLLKKSSMTTMLDRLEQVNYIKRISSQSDRRKINVKLTGKSKLQNYLYEKASKEMVDIFYKGFSKSEIGKIENFLSRILDNLIEYEEQ